MRTNTSLLLLLFCSLLILGNTACKQEASEADRQKPNIVFILIDDLGWADLSCYGNTFHRTPRIDQLAGRGMLFTDAYAPSAVCSPSRAAIMSA